MYLRKRRFIWLCENILPVAFLYDFDDSIHGNWNLEDVYIPIINTENVPYEIEESDNLRQTRGLSLSDHVI